ncbi:MULTISPECIES: ABC transporter substrate-binding protein [Dehalobacter]|uniref:Uncharacterized protein n=2 Tax=Dehalobacter restrictus TaxID=55583 RepID=A0ABN4BUF9_DEHRP|nr:MULTISPECIES: ABC transporter substrate-binding protein [unclassified Dehalobacter]AHF11046.1 hypothetical protein DEHRE_14030 [Dehalobacter restrictus DSM 9455]MDJ0305189.1 ABC transporter substrate-binding protein [Dehalobacter sp.]OCZ53908.1 hypothetical protein A7D23_06310 [Dehalobacter sp. TeCB1]
MEKRLEALLCIMIIILSLTALTACSKGPSPGEPGGDAPAVISVWYSLDGKEEQALLAQFARINKEYPEVSVKGEKIAEADIVQQVWNYQAGAEGPEIVIARRQILDALYKKGAVSPVLADIDSAYPAARAVFTYNKQAFAAPWLTDVPLLYYRKDKVLVPPASLAEIWEKHSVIAVPGLNASLLSPWWRAEGGTLSANGVPALDSQKNRAFINNFAALRQQNQVLLDSAALARFAGGETGYLLTWASDSTRLTNIGGNWDCLSFYSLLGAKGQVLLEHTIGIANSSIKTIPVMESAIRLVEEELLKPAAEEAMFQAGGRLPVNSAYYESATKRFQSEVALSLQSAWYLEGSVNDWTYLDLLNSSWQNIAGGANMESELARIQQDASDIGKQTK